MLGCEGSDPVPRGNLKKCLKLAQQRVKLTQKLDLRAEFVDAMISFSRAAKSARDFNISIGENDPYILKREAWRYAKMYGDRYIHFYNKEVFTKKE